MQTFLPHDDFPRSLATLKQQHLGGQLNEAYQLLIANTGWRPEPGPGWEERIEPFSSRWRFHTVARQWRGFEGALFTYLAAVVQEGNNRGVFLDTDVLDRAEAMMLRADIYAPQDPSEVEMPPWMGDDRVHASHRSNLLRKDPEFYGQWDWDEEPDLPYFYPHGLAGEPGPYFVEFDLTSPTLL